MPQHKKFYKFKFAEILYRFILIIFCALCLNYSSAHASRSSEENKELENFLAVSLSNTVWADTFKSDEKQNLLKPLKKFINKIQSNKYYKSRMDYNPWFYENVYRRNGLPKHNAINKWDENISIAIGWPRYIPAHAHLQPAPIQSQNRHVEDAENFFPLIRTTAQEMIPFIQEATGLPVEFFDVDDPRETSADYARIRIIPMNLWPPRNDIFKESMEWRPTNYEIELQGAVSFDFTDESRMKRMDGYFLPDENNNLALSICKIRMDLNENSFQSAVRECLIRSTGLPGMTEKSAETVLDGEHEITSKSTVPLSSFDLGLVKMLYCPEIKQGMRKRNVMKAFEMCRDMTIQ